MPQNNEREALIQLLNATAVSHGQYNVKSVNKARKIAIEALQQSQISQNEQQEVVGYIDEFGNFENSLKQWMIDEPDVKWKPLYTSPPKQAIPEGWISVKDKHPEQYAAVLVARFDGKYWTISKDAYQFGNNYAYDRDQNNVKVSHWMPLPPAPTNTEVGE